MKPATSIIDIYKPWIEEGSILYQNDTSNNKFIEEIIHNFGDVKKDALKAFGYDEHNILSAPKEVWGEINANIKANPIWRTNLKKLVDTLRIDNPIEEIINGVIIPHWNEPLTDVKHLYDKDKNKLKVKTKMIHSYISSLLRTKVVEEYSFNPAGVIGILHNEKDMVIGIRGGQLKRGDKNLVPAGSIKARADGDKIFTTLYDELKEEIGFNKNDIEAIELIGSVQDHSYTRISLFVANLFTRLSNDEIYKKWGDGADKFEHLDLLFIPYDKMNFERFLEENVNLTGKEEGKLMTLGLASLLAFGCYSFGKDWLSTLPDSIKKTSRFLPYDEKQKLFD